MRNNLFASFRAAEEWHRIQAIEDNKMYDRLRQRRELYEKRYKRYNAGRYKNSKYLEEGDDDGEA